MAWRKGNALRIKPRPNLALQAVRRATGLSQAEFARLLGVSKPYVQAVEIGGRAASVEFAEKVRDHTGAWPRCIVESWPHAIDVSGVEYTAESAKNLAWQLPEPCSDAIIQGFIAPLRVILKGAGIAGKSGLALGLVRDKLHEAASRALSLEGVWEATAWVLSTDGPLSSKEHHLRFSRLAGTESASVPSEVVRTLWSRRRTSDASVEDLLRGLTPLDPVDQPVLIQREAVQPPGQTQRKKAEKKLSDRTKKRKK